MLRDQPGCRRISGSESPPPRLVLAVEAEKIIEHGFAIVTAKDVNSVLVSDDGVLTASRADKLIALGHSSPFVNGFERTEVESQALGALGPVQVKV